MWKYCLFHNISFKYGFSVFPWWNLVEIQTMVSCKFPFILFKTPWDGNSFTYHKIVVLWKAILYKKLHPCYNFHLSPMFQCNRLAKSLVLHSEPLFIYVGNKMFPQKSNFFLFIFFLQLTSVVTLQQNCILHFFFPKAFSRLNSRIM